MGNANRIPHGPITAKRIDMVENETRTTSLPPSLVAAEKQKEKEDKTNLSPKTNKISITTPPDKKNTITTDIPKTSSGTKALHPSPFSQSLPSIRIRATAVSMQGWREDMEDAHEIIPKLSLPSVGPTAFFFLADGHGGSRVAQYAARHIVPRLLFANFENRIRCGAELRTYQDFLLTSASPAELALHIEQYQQQQQQPKQGQTTTATVNLSEDKGVRSNLWSPLYLPQDYDSTLNDSELHEPLRQAFRDLDQQLYTTTHSTTSNASKPSAFQSDYTGCTAIAAVISPSFIHIANAGDSRAVLFRNPDAPDTEKYARLIHHAFGGNSSSSSSSSSSSTDTNNSSSSSSSANRTSTVTNDNNENSSHHKTNFTTNSNDNHSSNEWLLTPVPMSIDHKPYLPQEYARIVASGSIVTVGGNANGPPRINGELAVSRAIGDFNYKHRNDIRSTVEEHLHHPHHPHNHHGKSTHYNNTLQPLLPPHEQAVCPIPDVSAIKRSIHDRFLVLACDGLWDVMSNNDVAHFLSEREFRLMNRSAIAKALQSPFDNQDSNYTAKSPLHAPSTFPPGSHAPGIMHGKATSNSMVPSTFAYDSNVTTTAAAAGAAARMQRIYENNLNNTTNGNSSTSSSNGGDSTNNSTSPAVSESGLRNNPPSPFFRSQGSRNHHSDSSHQPPLLSLGDSDKTSNTGTLTAVPKDGNVPLTLVEAANIAANVQQQQNDILSVLKGMGGSLGRSFSSSLKNGKRNGSSSGSGSTNGSKDSSATAATASHGKLNGLMRSNSTNTNFNSSTTTTMSTAVRTGVNDSSGTVDTVTSITPLNLPPIDPTREHDTSHMVTIQEIATIVADLADEALKRGSHDNITIILIAFPSAFSIPSDTDNDADSTTSDGTGSGAMPLGVQLERKLYVSSKDSNSSSRNASNNDLHSLFANLKKENKENN